MRLYLSSFRLGNKPQAMLDLLPPGSRRVAVIANAADHKGPEGRAMAVEQELQDLRALGLDPCELDLRQFFGKPGIAEALQGSALVWARGGNVFNLRRAFRYSGADEVVREMLLRDEIAYAGYSAGVCLLAPDLRGTELVDSPHASPAGYGEEVVWEGLGVVPFAIAPHYRTPEHPETHAIDLMVQHYIDHHVPFIALSDGQAIVIRGDERTVVE